MARSALFLLALLASSGVVLGTKKAACPFKNAPKKEPEKNIRGHNKPFGYHARQWQRIDTMYEHPHPEEFYAKYMRTSRPLVIRGGAKDWPAIKKWTNLTYVGSHIDSNRAEINWKKMYDYDPYHPVRVRMRMDEFIKNFDEHNLYMDTTLPGKLAKDVHWPKSLACKFYQKRLKQVAVMFNNGKSNSDYHMDATCTYFIQVTGSRRWLLTPPSHIDHVYSGFPSLVDHTGISAVNQTHVDLEKHLNVSKLPIYGAVMHPGDIIYVPEGWHHQVKTYDSPNIGVVAFLNYLMCDMHNEGDADIYHVRKCTGKILDQRPKHMKCNVFKEDVLTIPQLLKKYPPPAPENFAGRREPDYISQQSTIRIMNNDRPLYPMGIGFSKKADAKNVRQVLKQALTEGYRLFCVDPTHNDALDLMRKVQPRKARAEILTYLPSSEFGLQKASDFIDNLIKRLNVSRIDFLLMQADYCPSVNGEKPCDRNHFTNDMLSTWRVMEKAVLDRKVNTIGVSDFSQTELETLVSYARVPVSIARARFDPWFRNTEFRRYCHKKKIAFMGRHILGGRWAVERPDLKEERDITKSYYILKAGFQYKISVHAVVYDYAMKKAVFICPPLEHELQVRVDAQSFRSMSTQLIDNILDIDKLVKDDDNKIFAPEANNRIDISSKATRDIFVGKEEFQTPAKWERMSDEEVKTYKKTQNDYSSKLYTDKDDFEIFPSYLNVKETNFKVES